MKRDDHLALSARLLSLDPQLWSDRRLRAAVYAGSVLPDSNPITYLRGALRAGKPAGHDRGSSYALILRLFAGLKRTGVTDVRQAYRLGALMHYLADAMTYPHTPEFHGGVSAHNRYERALHRVFRRALAGAGRCLPPPDPFRLLSRVLSAGAPVSHAPEENAAEIVSVCTAIWLSVFQENAGKSLFSNKKS